MKREEFQEQAKQKIDDIFRKIDELEVKKEAASESVKEKIGEQIEALKQKKNDLLEKFDNLKEASAESWEDLKEAFTESTEVFWHKITGIKKHFRD